MSHILISGLVNTETTAKVRGFPIVYYPIDYTFFGVDTAVSGVAYNITAALRTLGDQVTLLSMIGNDFAGAYILEELGGLGVDTGHIRRHLRQTPSSVVLYDETGRRQIYCDLKDIQESVYPFAEISLEDVDLVVACNTNFNRPLLRKAKSQGKRIAVDVHVLGDIRDEYNRDFLEAADILFLSDEAIGEDYRGFLKELACTYGNEIIVLGRGCNGAAMYIKADGQIRELPAASVGPVVNTVGAGDALFSAFIHYYAKEMPPQECLRRAQIFAAAKIGTSGAARGFITEEKIDDLL